MIILTVSRGYNTWRITIIIDIIKFYGLFPNSGVVLNRAISSPIYGSRC